MESKRPQKLDSVELKKILDSVKDPSDKIDLTNLTPEEGKKLVESGRVSKEVLAAVSGGSVSSDGIDYDVCPECGSTNVKYEQLRYYDFVLITCRDCWASWRRPDWVV